MNNQELKQLVLASLPIQDAKKITIRGYKPEPTTSTEFRKIYAPYYDVTKQVKQLLKEGKIKRERRYGFGHSGRAGHTFFVENV